MNETPLEFTITVEAADTGARVDAYLAKKLDGYSRNHIQKLLQEGHVTLNNTILKDRSYRINETDVLVVVPPEPEPLDLTPADIVLDILYEDEDILVINKPIGLTVHPGAGTKNDTLVHALLAHCKDSLSGIGGVERPGIVHRLDRDTSGLMVVAKNDQAHLGLSNQLQDRTLSRHYIAFCWGLPKPTSGTVDTLLGRSSKNRQKMAVVPVGGKHAVTHYETLKVYGNQLASKVRCRLETGRTHQIRVHLAHIGYALLGDQSYGSNRGSRYQKTTPELKSFLETLNHQALHACYLSLTHPVSGKQMEFKCPLPEKLAELEELLEGV